MNNRCDIEGRNADGRPSMRLQALSADAMGRAARDAEHDIECCPFWSDNEVVGRHRWIAGWIRRHNELRREQIRTDPGASADAA